MSKLNSCNKENKNLNNVLLSQGTLRRKYFSPRSNKKSSSVTKINSKLENNSVTRFFSKQKENCLNFKKPMFLSGSKQVTEDNILLSQSSLSSSFCQDENKVKSRNGKLKFHKRNPLVEANNDCHHDILEAKSNFTPQKPVSQTSQAPLKIPKHFKLNTRDLKLKSPLVKKSLICKLKKNGSLSNGNSIHSPHSGKFNDNRFDFLEGKLSTFLSLKHNTDSRADREAFDVFSFPIKHSVDKHSISDMGSMTNSASVYKEKNSNKHSSSLKINLPAKDMSRKSDTIESNSNLDKSNMIDSKFMTQYSIKTNNSNENTEVKIGCLEETQFASPILGDTILAVGSDSNASSPVLDSMMKKTSKLQTDELDQSRISLSPILNRSEDSCKEIIHRLKMKSLHCNVTNGKPNACIVENEGANCQKYYFSSQIVGSPVLDSSQQKKDIFMQKFQTASCKSYLNPKLDDEFSPSPVLDASVFKAPFGKLNNLLFGDNCLNPTVKEVMYVSHLRQNNGSLKVNCGTSHETMLNQEHCFESNKGFEEKPCLKEIEHKENINCDVSLNLLGKLNNEGCFIDRSRLNPLEAFSEPMSQVLGSNGAKHVWSEANNATESKLESIHTPVCLATASEVTIFHPQSTSKFKNTIIDVIDSDKDKFGIKNAWRFPVFSSHDERMDSCSPVLDSSQCKRNILEKQTKTQTSKCQESWSKVYTGSQSSRIKNHLDLNKSESVKLHCNKMLINVPPSTNPSSSSISLGDLGNLIAGQVPLCNQSKTSTTISEKCFTESTLLEPVKSAEYHLSHSIFHHLKRKHSPITESKKRFKNLKSKSYGGEMEHLGPMLGLVSKSPVSDNGLCPNVSNLDQDEKQICSPSFNSELDIRKFPIMLPDLLAQCSPKERSEKLQTDNNYGIIMSSQKYLENLEGGSHEEGLSLKNSCQEKIELNLSDKSKLLLASSNFIAESTTNSISYNPELMSPILSRSEACKNLNISPRANKNDFGNSPLLKKDETHNQNQFTENNSNSREYSVSQETGKKNVRKNLALYYEEAKSVTRSMNDEFSKHLCSENEIRIQPKNKKTLNDEGMACESQISGVGKLQTLPSEYADSEKLLIICEHQNSNGQMPLMLENDSLSHNWVKPREPTSSNKSVLGKNSCENVNTESKQHSRWKNQVHQFDDNEEICIEDFDEESPLDKENAKVTIDASKLDSVKKNLNHNIEQSPSCTVITKQFVPEVKNLLLHFELRDHSKNMCEYMSSEESSCEVEIQEDFSQRTSETSPAFRIEYSTTPTTKSSEGTQNEAGSNPPSFPPALDVEANIPPSAEVLDSACKNRRSRVKKGSAAERLRRLVRGQRAEVNMFHHEASAPARARARACSLCVTSATQTCSLLVLICRYMDAQRMTSQEFGTGEEVIDPEVHVYIDPSFAKNITAGSVVTVFPPWLSVWHESRGVVVMYCVTKLQLGTHNRSLPGIGMSLTCRSNAARTIQEEFSCQFQDEHCDCRSQLVGQLFTAPQQSQWAVHCAGGADGAITAALAGGWFPHRVKVILTMLHSFQTRSRNNKVQTRMLCVDANGHICQLNLRCEQDIFKLGPPKEALHKTFVMKKLTVCRRIFIDRCKGLRSFLTHLHTDSANQQIMYVATPSSDEWTAQLIEETADSLTSADIHSRITCYQKQLLSLPINEEVEGRARARIRVMAVRGDELFAWDPQLDSYFKMNITASAAIPNFPARACLDLLYLWAHHGELTIDKFTEVVLVEGEEGDFPTIPPLAVESTEGNLVLLDSIVTKVSSEAYLRWEGSCGHKVLRVQQTGLYFCLTCRQTSASSTQKVVLEVCVAALDIPYPIRVKVKSETARVLLADSSGQISSDKSYNMIGVIGSTLKCLAVVTEVLRNSFGDIIEFILDEL